MRFCWVCNDWFYQIKYKINRRGYAGVCKDTNPFTHLKYILSRVRCLFLLFIHCIYGSVPIKSPALKVLTWKFAFILSTTFSINANMAFHDAKNPSVFLHICFLHDLSNEMSPFALLLEKKRAILLENSQATAWYTPYFITFISLESSSLSYSTFFIMSKSHFDPVFLFGLSFWSWVSFSF